MPSPVVTVVGGGLAGVEAAWVCAGNGVQVQLYEMRPSRKTGAHITDFLAELVCSNSFKSNFPNTPIGQLKYEMAQLGSIILEVAADHRVPAGEALAVDRNLFSEAVTSRIQSHPLINVIREHCGPEEVKDALQQGPVIISTGPLTSPELSEWLAHITGKDGLYFYDAVSPTLESSSLDFTQIFAASRYGKGDGDDYLNCPFDRDQYFAFVKELVNAERSLPHGVVAEDESLEKIKYFTGCTPIEAIAETGEMSLAFGNFKPVGLTNPATGKRPFAALQLRPENREKTLYSLVGCQNRLKWGEQKRIFRMVPGLENAEFVRFGVIHRNTYLDSPKVLEPTLELKEIPGIFIAGQLTGVEGYTESAAMGILAGLSACYYLKNEEIPRPPRQSAYGSLLAHLQDQTEREFAPMNINWGLFPNPIEFEKDKSVKHAKQIQLAKEKFLEWHGTLLKNPKNRAGQLIG